MHFNLLKINNCTITYSALKSFFFFLFLEEMYFPFYNFDVHFITFVIADKTNVINS